ncbi:MAG: protocatechuate 3,4-dioxygenase subunit beta, partial [Rhizobium giardinii]
MSDLSNKKPETGAFFQRDRAWHAPALTPGYKTSVLRSPQKALLSLDGTISEITGPVFGHSILGELDNDLIHNFARPGESAIGERIIVHGRVLDERGKPLPGALLEFWQANAGGRYRHRKETYLAPLDPNFGGCGRAITDADGTYRFRTIKPGPYPWPNGVNDWRPAHIHFSIFGHGFAQRLITQMYFEGDPMIWKCPIVTTIPDRRAIEQLIA